MWRTIAVSCGIIGSLATARSGSGATPSILAIAGQERFAIERAVAVAARRLADAGCRLVLADFEDRSGRTLADNLAALGKDAVEFFNELYFVDDRETPCCLTRGTLAFTAPGHRVIHVCGRRFAAVSLNRSVYGDAVMIHEMLHALGLGENPPRSSEITARVLSRCS